MQRETREIDLRRGGDTERRAETASVGMRVTEVPCS